MRLSELSAQTGVAPATLKFYLREGLLQPGTPVTRTQSDYSDDHVQRVRLIRALVEVGGLELASVRRVLETITAAETPERLELMEVAATTLPAPSEAVGDEGWVRDWIQARGWQIAADEPLVAHLAGAWEACEQAGLGVTLAQLDAYADAAERIAVVDVASVPREPALAVRQVVLGTVLVEPVLAILRRLAQQHVAVSGAVGTDR